MKKLYIAVQKWAKYLTSNLKKKKCVNVMFSLTGQIQDFKDDALHHA